jgi:integrase/recombinase XerD
MATIAIVLKTTQKLSNDEYAVALRVTHERKPKYYLISTLVVNQSQQWRCTKDQWRPAEKEDNGLGLFRKSFSRYKEHNALLETKLKHANEILNHYDQLSIPFSFKSFEQDLKDNVSEIQNDVTRVKSFDDSPNIPNITIFDYYSQQIKILDEQKRVGMAGLYLENQSILTKFKPNGLLTDVNFRFLESFEYWMRNVRGNKDTTISVKMRNLQRVINQAIEDKLFRQEDYPFGTKRKFRTSKMANSRIIRIVYSFTARGRKQLVPIAGFRVQICFDIRHRAAAGY